MIVAERAEDRRVYDYSALVSYILFFNVIDTYLHQLVMICCL